MPGVLWATAISRCVNTRAQELDQAREANVVTAAIAALSAIAASLPWPQYQQLLGQFLRLMRRHADGNKVTPAIAAAAGRETTRNLLRGRAKSLIVGGKYGS